MPTYEYRCDQCGDRFEIFQSFTDKPLRRHAHCGGKVEKVFHPRGVVFKGSGFYVTDSRVKAKASSENGSSGTSGDGSSKSEISSTSDNGSSKSESSSSSNGADKSTVASDPKSD